MYFSGLLLFIGLCSELCSEVHSLALLDWIAEVSSHWIAAVTSLECSGRLAFVVNVAG